MPDLPADLGPGAPTARGRLLLPLGVALAVASFWSPILGEGLRTGDFPGHVALIRVLSDMLAADPTLPLWDARGYLGTSLVAGYLLPIGSLLLLSPFTLFFGAERGLELGCLAYLVLASLSMYAWCLAWGGSRPGAALGALVYALHPAAFRFVGDGGQMHQPVTLAILPLVFLAWTRLAASPSPGRVLVASLAAALLLLDVERFFLAMPFVGIVFLASARRVPAAVGAAACASLGVLLLLCFPVLPILEERSLLQWHDPAILGAWRSHFSLVSGLELLDRDGLFASLVRAAAPETASPAGGWYQGGVAIAFVALGSVWVSRTALDARRRLRLAATLGCWPVVVALAFGPQRLLTSQTAQARRLLDAGAEGAVACVALLAIALVWIASFGWLRAELLARWPQRRWQVDGGVLAVALLLGLAAPFGLLSGAIPVYTHIRAPAHFAFPMLGLLLGTAVCLVAPGWVRIAGSPRRAAAVFALVAGLHALDVLPYVTRLSPQLSPRVEARLREAFRGLAERPEGRILDVSGYSPLTDMLAAVEAGHPSARGWLAWMSMRHSSEFLVDGVTRSLLADDIEGAARLAGLANVRFFSRIATSGGHLPESEALLTRVRRRGVTLAENRRVLPYAQLYPRIAWLSGPNPERLPLVAGLAREGIASYTLDPRAGDPRPEGPPDFVWGSDAERLAPEAARVPEGVGRRARDVSAPCRVERPRDTEVRLRCRFTSAGVLVIAESWSPRWEVEVDGEVRPLLRLNHAFQGVAVAAGDARVRFAYRASPLTRASLGVSALCWLSLLAFGGRALLRRP